MSLVSVIIPARLSSRRLPGKVLAEIAGLPMVVHVMQRASRARSVDRVVVATADQEVERAVAAHGGEVIRTRGEHRSGSDRIAEAMESLGIGTGDFVVNVQGDEPLLDPATIEGVILRLQNGAQVATAAAPLRGDPDDPSVVKLVVDSSGRAVYFSRSAIPSGGPWLQHIGIYGFRPDALRRFSQLPASFLEKSERLEQLRLLEHGIPVDVIRVAEAGLSVDTPEDLARARKMISRTVQRSTPPSLLESSSLD